MKNGLPGKKVVKKITSAKLIDITLWYMIPRRSWKTLLPRGGPSYLQ
jgi:hypothetical protein